MSERPAGVRRWRVGVVIALCALAYCPTSEAVAAADAATPVVARARSHDNAACNPWQAADTGQAAGALKGVASLSPTDSWAVGVQGDLAGGRPSWQPITAHWNGTRWSAVASPGQGILNAVAAAPGSVWAVGEIPGRTASQPLAQRWDGTRWTVVPAAMPATAVGAFLNGVAVSSPRDAWAVGGVDGGGTLIEHWDGTRWSIVTTPDTGIGSALAAVAVSSPRDAWAVGSNASSPIVEHWNGTRWSISSRAGYGALLAVAARSAGNVWAVGRTGGQFGEPLVQHWDGTRWLVVQSPRVNTVAGGSGELAGVTIVAPGDVWAVGTIATPAVATTRALTEHWDGTRWRVTPGGTDRLTAVTSAGPGAIWAVGGAAPLGTAAPLVQRYAGPTCYLLDPVRSISTVGPSPGLLAVDGATGRAFSGNLDSTVSVVDTSSGRTIARVGVGRPPLAIALDETGGRVFVATDNTAASGTVWVLDAVSGTVLDLISVGPHPASLALDQRDDRLLVECAGDPNSNGTGAGVSMVDLSQDNVVATVPMSAPGTLLLDQQHGRAVVAVRGGVVFLDVAAGTAAAPVAIGTSSALALDQGAGRVFVAEPGGVNVLDATTGAVVGASDEANVSSLAVDEAGGRVYAGAVAANDGAITIHVLDALSGRWLRSIDAGQQPNAAITALLFDGVSRRVVVAWAGAGAGEVGIYDAASGAAINVVAGVVAPAVPVVDGQSGRLFVASSLQANHAGAPAGSGIVSVLDLISGAVVDTVPVGVAPRTVLLDGASRRLYVLDDAVANGALDGSVDAIDADLRPGAMVSLPPTPADPVAPSCCAARYFAPTGHTMAGPFLAFWSAHGGVDTFGYPRTEPFREGGILVQYTDRFLLEDVSGLVRAGPLGIRLTANRSFVRVAPFVSTRDRLYFPRTGYSLSWLFLRYWQAHGLRTAVDPLQADPLLGAPISEVITEGNGDGSGRRYRVQWFENGRLEYHPELAGTRYTVEVGLAGLQALEARGWLPPIGG